jgi:glycosyltransferase involved in cell wall biosynthesis
MWLLRRECGARTVVDNDDWEGRGGWLDVNPYPAAQKAVFAWQEGWCLRSARAVTCASETLVERTRQLRGSVAGEVLLFPNGPDNALRDTVATAEARRDSLRADFGWANKHMAIYAGTIPLNHDLDVIVDSLRMPSLREMPPLALCIIASGPGIASLQAAFERSGLAGRVEWHGFMPHDKLVERLTAADVALYPYRDTNINRAKCSGKVMDYMAAGKPMVVSNVGMNRVYLEHERSALLTPPGDVRAFGAAWLRLASDPVLAETLGRAAQTRIWDAFGWDGRIAALEALYARIQAAVTR